MGRDIIDASYSETLFVNNRCSDKIDILGAFSSLYTKGGAIFLISAARSVRGLPRVTRTAPHPVSVTTEPSQSKYGDCTKEQHSKLHDDYSRFCKDNPFSCKKSFVNCCEKVKKRLANATECHKRRKKFNDICFKGGRGSAFDEVKKAEQAINTCMEKYKLYKCK